MSDEKIAQSLDNLLAALERLREALDEPADNSLVVDGTIQRFEFVIELCWKTIKRALAAENVRAHTPREVVQQAYEAQWLDDESLWLAMLQDRNETSYVYNEAVAREIYERIGRYLPEMQRVHDFLRRRLESGR